jgi:hypothetical protein
LDHPQAVSLNTSHVVEIFSYASILVLIIIIIIIHIITSISRDSSVGIATGLDDQGRREFESRQGKKFSLFHIVQTGSGVHPTSYKMGTVGSFQGVKRQGREADHSPTSTEVKKMRIYTSIPLYVFMA